MKWQIDERLAGVTELCDRIYFIGFGSNTIDVLHSKSFIRLDTIFIPDAVLIVDMAGCHLNMCLYLVDSGEQCVWKVMLNGNIITKLLNDKVSLPMRISVVSQGRVLMPSQNPVGLNIYTCHPDGELNYERFVKLPPNLKRVQTAVETSTRDFVVIYIKDNDTYCICNVNKAGNVISSSDIVSGPGEKQIKGFIDVALDSSD